MATFNDIHVLIVEDDSASTEVLGHLLTRLNISYTTLYDSRRALDAIRQLPRLDAVFLDLEMPGSSGYAVLDAIKASPDLERVPIVAYTAHLSEMSNARDAGFHSFMGKPLRSADFPEQMANILNNVPVWAVR